ncbi:MAG: CHAT domain-containing protein, partial [Acidobacteria bacterium]|nr:CHAT domain-containing protein [Acidobacteriota bacterium]
MRTLLRSITCLLSILLAHSLLVAQTPEREFESAVNQYTVKYRELLKARAVTRIDVEEERGQAVAAVENSESILLKGAAPLSVKYARNSALNDFRQALENRYAPGTALIFYAYQGDSLQIWLIGQNGFQAYSSRAVSAQNLESAIRTLRHSMGVDSLQAARAPSRVDETQPAVDVRLNLSMDEAIARVTDILLPPPIAERLSSVRHLIIAPILGIGTVPFAVLRPFKSETFLIEKMSVSVAPNLFDIEDDTRPWTPQYRNPLVIGNPYFPRDAKWKVPPLPGAEEEALAIGKMINARPLVRRRATKSRVLAKAAGADFLYFATHG